MVEVELIVEAELDMMEQMEEVMVGWELRLEPVYELWGMETADVKEEEVMGR